MNNKNYIRETTENENRLLKKRALRQKKKFHFASSLLWIIVLMCLISAGATYKLGGSFIMIVLFLLPVLPIHYLAWKTFKNFRKDAHEVRFPVYQYSGKFNFKTTGSTSGTYTRIEHFYLEDISLLVPDIFRGCLYRSYEHLSAEIADTQFGQVPLFLDGTFSIDKEISLGCMDEYVGPLIFLWIITFISVFFTIFLSFFLNESPIILAIVLSLVGIFLTSLYFSLRMWHDNNAIYKRIKDYYIEHFPKIDPEGNIIKLSSNYEEMIKRINS